MFCKKHQHAFVRVCTDCVVEKQSAAWRRHPPVEVRDDGLDAPSWPKDSYGRPYAPEFLGAQPAKVGEDY